jgi:hypothetical protein
MEGKPWTPLPTTSTIAAMDRLVVMDAGDVEQAAMPNCWRRGRLQAFRLWAHQSGTKNAQRHRQLLCHGGDMVSG